MNISFDDFLKLDIRIGKIIDVQEHPNADRLFILQVDLGETQTQIVAGIRGHYSKEELVGKKISVITNLEPRTIRGIDSKGMLLAASDDFGLSLIVPEKDIHIGSRVK